MRGLEIAEASQIILALHDEIRRSEDARYDHRLHSVLLVAQGMSCSEVSSLLGDSLRTVQNWVNRFERSGFAGLREHDRPGRTPKLTESQIARIGNALRSTPEAHGLTGHLWDGKTLSKFVLKEFDVEFSTRQCQRLFRKLGFRYRKPRPMIANADPELKASFNQTRRARR